MAEQPSDRGPGIPVRRERDQDAEQPSDRGPGIPASRERDQEREQPSDPGTEASDAATELGRTIVAQARAIRRRMIQDAEERRRATRDALEAARTALDEALAALDVDPAERDPDPDPPGIGATPLERARDVSSPGASPRRPESRPEAAPEARSAVRSPEAAFALLRGGASPVATVARAPVAKAPAAVAPPAVPAPVVAPPVVAPPVVSPPVVAETGVVEATSESSTDDDVRARREEVLASVLPDLLRATQRVLGDEHNILLDALRRAGSRIDAAQLLPDPVLHREAWSEVLGPALDATYAGGRAAVGAPRPGRGAPARLVKELAEGVVAPLRDRLATAIDAGLREGPYGTTAELHRVLGAAISARYREWRGGDLERHLADLLAAAYAQGSYDAAPSGGRLRWIPAEPGQCPDCDDNALEPTVKGQAFPTGRPRPPAHPGCRCLIVLAE